MHFNTTAVLALLSATVAVAAPTASSDYKPYHNKDKYNKDCDEDWKSKWDNDDWKKSEKLFYFDSEYYVKATPDQVIGTDGVPAPGQPGAKGIFKYGINVAENTICYVSQDLSMPYQFMLTVSRTLHSLALPANTSRLLSPLPTFTRPLRASLVHLALLSPTPRVPTTAVSRTAA
jgi:hypothetical protein